MLKTTYGGRNKNQKNNLFRLGYHSKKEEKMIRWTRTAQIAAGKHQEAVQWAKDLREYTKSKMEYSQA